MSFTATTHQNEFLPEGSGEVHAIVTVEASDTLPAMGGASGERCIVLVVDTSGSMAQPMGKIVAARQAVAAAVAEIPDGVLFAVVAGSHEAKMVFPGDRVALIAADETSRAAAIDRARTLQPNGGTAISTWLDLTRQLFIERPSAINLAYLLTDGKNESEPATHLARAIESCVGLFQCDTRGVGDQWVVAELRTISSALLGEVGIVREPDLMDDDFRDFMARAMDKDIGDVRLRVWTPQGSTIKFVRQVAPAIEDLSDRGEDAGRLTLAFPTGAWAAGESRDYHVCIEVEPGGVGEEKLAARIGLAIDDDVVSQGLVRAVWSEDDALTTRINPEVAHYTGQEELAEAIKEGLAARREGDEASATVKLGRAVQLAHENGNEATVRLLGKVVEVEDPATGTVRLKRKVEELDEMELDTRSTRTVRVTPKE